jgi:hypothetical protein
MHGPRSKKQPILHLGGSKDGGWVYAEQDPKPKSEITVQELGGWNP